MKKITIAILAILVIGSIIGGAYGLGIALLVSGAIAGFAFGRSFIMNTKSNAKFVKTLKKEASAAAKATFFK